MILLNSQNIKLVSSFSIDFIYKEINVKYIYNNYKYIKNNLYYIYIKYKMSIKINRTL